RDSGDRRIRPAQARALGAFLRARGPADRSRHGRDGRGIAEALRAPPVRGRASLLREVAGGIRRARQALGYFRRHSVLPPGLSSRTMPATSSSLRISSARLKSFFCLAAERSSISFCTSSDPPVAPLRNFSGSAWSSPSVPPSPFSSPESWDDF